MTTINPKSGADSWVRSDHVNQPGGGGPRIRLLATARRGFVRIPLTNIRGETIVSAKLIGHVAAGFAPQTVTVSAPVEKWSEDNVTWRNQPSVTTSIDTALSGSFADGDAVELDILTIVQHVAAGSLKWRGLRLTTDATDPTDSVWYSFDSGRPSWELVIELSDLPDPPTDLRPTGDHIGSPAPILSWQPFDNGGDAFAQGAYHVQADPDADEVSPVFDSGWQTSVDPEADLSDLSFTPLSSGGTLRWRVRIRDASGVNVSEWSDWTDATIYTPYPTLTVDSPTGGTIGDATPTVEAHLTGETLTRWRVRVLDAANETLWDSGLRKGALAVDVPWRDPDTRRRILSRDDATYTFDIRAFGDVARATAVGLPSYVRQVVSVVYDDDIGVAPVTSYTVAPAAPGDPRLTHTWHRTEDADAWLLLRDGDVVERLETGIDVSVSAGVYTWTDSGLSIPYTSHSWTVRAVESGARSAAATPVVLTSKPSAVWLIPIDVPVDPIRLKGITSLDSFARLDRRATYQLVASGVDVDIIYAQEGISGSFEGTVSDDAGLTRHALAEADRVNKLGTYPEARVRMVWATQSVPVKLRDLAALPHSTFDDATRRHRVSFSFQQLGD